MADVRFKNISKVEQTFYTDEGESRTVIPTGTILLPLAVGKKHRRVLEQVVVEEATANVE